MKKVLIAVGALFLLLIVAAFVLPALFKDDIKAAIDKELAKSVNADVVFDIDKFNLTLFRNFPNLTVRIGDFGVINRAPFEGEVLFATERLEVEVNLKDILFGDELRVKGISLVNPIINIKVLEDGRANYDIAIPGDTTEVAEEDTTGFSFGIDHWEIVNGDIAYDDRSMPYYLKLKGFNHEGSGDFTQDLFDLKTHTEVDTVSTSFDGMELLTNKHAVIDAVISIGEDYSRYTFKQNEARINDFVLNFDGWFKMNEDNYEMDISFASPEGSFKSLLSLVPGMYVEGFDKIGTDGSLAFGGMVKGTLSDKQMPGFHLDLKVNDAMFKYPDLPTPVSNINLDVLVDNKDGVMENTFVDIKKFHLDFGNNPFDARATIKKTYPTDLSADLNARLNLEELSRMFPIKGLEMKGNYAVNLKANGVYDSVRKIMPSVEANMSLANGYVKSSEFPVPLEDLTFSSSIRNTSGKLAETVIAVNAFSMSMEGEKLTAALTIRNLENMNWDVKVNGGADLGKLTKVFPIEGMTLAGKLMADIHTTGVMSDLEAERYDKLPTSGTASLTDFAYTSSDLPYGVTLKEASMAFDPKKIDLKKLQGTVGKSDFNVNGSVSNYLGYVFGKNEIIRGQMNFASTLLDLNEFMTESEEETAPTDSASYGVIPVPRDVDFVLASNIRTAKFMDLTVTNATGNIIVKDGVARLDGLRFGMLGGNFNVTGTYNTIDLEHPKYDLALKVENLSIQQSASAFTMVRTFAPMAGLVNGNFSTDFKVSGELQQDLMPNLGTVNGAGLIEIAQGSLTGSKLVSGITSLTKLDNSDKVTMKDVLMSASIKDGRLSVQPFDVNFGSYKTSVAGSTGIDGSINYSLKMDVPAGKLGTEFNSFVSQYTGGKSDPNAMVPLNIGLGGTVTDPAPKLIMTEQKDQAREAVTAAAKEQAKDKTQELVKGTEAEKLVGGLLGTKKDSTTQKSDTTASKPVEEVKQKVQEEATQKIQNLLKRKK